MSRPSAAMIWRHLLGAGPVGDPGGGRRAALQARLAPSARPNRSCSLWRFAVAVTGPALGAAMSGMAVLGALVGVVPRHLVAEVSVSAALLLVGSHELRRVAGTGDGRRCMCSHCTDAVRHAGHAVEGLATIAARAGYVDRSDAVHLVTVSRDLARAVADTDEREWAVLSLLSAPGLRSVVVSDAGAQLLVDVVDTLVDDGVDLRGVEVTGPLEARTAAIAAKLVEHLDPAAAVLAARVALA